MPSGRDVHSVKQYMPPDLDEDTLAHMRTPPERKFSVKSMEEESSDSEAEGRDQSDFPGAFPGSRSNGEAYY